MPLVVLQLPKTNSVKYSSKPLNGKDDIIEEHNPNEFASQCNFEWHDDLLINDSLIDTYEANKSNLSLLANRYLIFQELKPNQPIDEELIKSMKMPMLEKVISIQDKQAKTYLKQLEEIMPNLVVCDIDPRVGKGLFWRGPGDIKKGTAVICYTGVMHTVSPNRFSGYEYSVPSHPLFKEQSVAATGVIDGLDGNLARFVQHLPDSKQISQFFKLDSSIQFKDVATANVEPINFIYNGMPLVVLVAIEDIEPNAQIGYDYGLSYWAKAYRYSKIEPLLFNKKSEIIGSGNYERLFLNVEIANEAAAISYENILKCISERANYTFISNNNPNNPVVLSSSQLTELLVKELSQQNIKPNTILAYLQKWLEKALCLENSSISYQEKFINKIHCTLLKHWLHNSLNFSNQAHEKVNRIAKLINEISGCNDADKTFLDIRKLLDFVGDKDFYNKNLSLMRSEIIDAMKKYNEDKLKQKSTLSSVPANTK